MVITHKYTLAELQSLCCDSIQLTYNTDSADTVNLTFRPERWQDIGWDYGHRIELRDNAGRLVFFGTLTSAPAYSQQSTNGIVVSVQAASDLALFDRVAYTKTNADGVFIFPSVSRNSKFSGLSAYAADLWSWASGGKNSQLFSSTFEADVDARIPSPEGNGNSTCSALLRAAMQWVPDALLVTRYDDSGPKVKLTISDKLESLHLSVESSKLTEVSVQARPEAVPPVCALVGQQHYVIPADGDVREPGAFVFAVPVQDEDAPKEAGSSPASQKMIIRGIALPERATTKRDSLEFVYAPVTGTSKLFSFLRRFWPQYTPDILGGCIAGGCVVNVVPSEELNENDETTDEDAQKIPANYREQDEVQNWIDAQSGIYVLTEGSFAASSNNRKNLKGLLWSKAELSILLAIPLAAARELSPAARMAAASLFPSKARIKNADGAKTMHLTAKLTLNAVLINKRQRIYDAATNQPCSGDAEYETRTEPTESEYKAALRSYYNATRIPPVEGNVSLLFEGNENLRPEDLTGKRISLLGLNPEWENMNATIRSVTWDYATRKLNISFGSREVLGFDERLQRLLMARAPRRAAAQRLAIPADPLDSDAKKDEEANMAVSPSISASVAAASTAIRRKPFALYEEMNGESTTVWLAGGTLSRAGKLYNVPDTASQITRNEENGTPWVRGGGPIKMKWETVDGEVKYSIYQKSSSN